MKIVVIGSNGFLGNAASEILSQNNEVIEAGITSENKLDATKINEVRNFLLKHKPDVVLDAVALTSSTKCEDDPELAERLNYLTAKNISEVCREIGSWMIFISSSYLFDGKKGNYNENDKTSEINQYARTKIMAEREVLKNPKSIILRVDVMYGYNGKNKKNGVFDNILSGKEISVRDPHQLRQPIFVDDVPRIMVELMSKKQKGIFHLAGPERMEMLFFLKNLESIFRKDSFIRVIKDDSQKNKIKIPSNATFDTSKIRGLGINFTSFEDGLNIIGRRLNVG